MEAHVNGPKKEHDRNHGNEPTEELHISPIHPPGDEAQKGVAGVGGVIGQQTRDTDCTRFTGGTISAERLEAAQPQPQDYRTTAPIAYA
jgi:hypothetical protein